MARQVARHRGPHADPDAPIQRRGPSPGKRSMVGARWSDPGDEAAAPATGGGRPLPPRLCGEMQSLLGIDLEAIRIHEDGAAAEAGALAYTRGTDIHFAPGTYDPESQRGRELLGHELAHVAQQARGGVAATTEIGGVPVNADPGLEGEADRIGAQLARGESAAEPGAPLQTPRAVGAVAQRKEEIDGNPNDLTDASGNSTTFHGSPALSDAENPPGAPAAAGSESRQTHVMVLASQAHPFVAPAAYRPPSGLLYQETELSPAPPGFSTITRFDGTLAAPQLDQEATKALYIGGAPSPDDVDQGGLGDCYLLAAVASMAQRDPGKIKSMIKSDGAGGATITLWRAEQQVPTIVERILGTAPERTWTQVDVKVSDELAMKLSNGKVKGAALRAAPAPTSSEHWAELTGSKLEVHRKDLYDCARWAPLLEKAYARFAQSHGRYGGATKDARANPASGIDSIGDGGQSAGALRVLYGPAAEAEGVDLHRETTRWTGGGQLVAANAGVIDQLILLQGRQDAPGPAEADAPILTAATSPSKTISRLATAIAAAQSDPDWASIDPVAQALVASAAVLALAWKALPPDPDPPAARPREDVAKSLGDLCAQAIRPGILESSGEQERLGRIAAAVPAPISFAVGDAYLPAGAASQLASLNQTLTSERHPQVEVQIDGHASGDGVADPQALSEQRADTVEAALLSGGAVTPHLVAKAGHGESAGGPRVEMSVDALGRALNPLLDPTRSQPIRDLADLLLNLRNDGTDSSTGQRNVYTNHVYSVVAVSITMSNEVEVPLGAVPASLRHCLYPLVDPAVSTVTLRNPHHGNEPDRRDNDAAARDGDGDPDGSGADGIFRMSLRQFLLNFATVTSGVLPRS